MSPLLKRYYTQTGNFNLSNLWLNWASTRKSLNLANLWFRFSKFLTKMCKYQIREFCFNIGKSRINWDWDLWSTNYKCTCKSMQDWNLIILMKCWNFVATQICIKIKIEWGWGKSEIKSFERVKSLFGQRAKWNRITREIFFAFILTFDVLHQNFSLIGEWSW